VKTRCSKININPFSRKEELRMKKKIKTTQLILAICFVFALVLMYSMSNDCQAALKEIRIGASIPKTGPLSAFGLYEEWGFTTVVNDINKEGGVYLSKEGKKLPVKLILYDDESRPEKTTENMERLILRDEVHAVLGSATPPLVIAGAAVAEREGVPMVSALCPIRAFLGSRDQWNWVWDLFFDELEMTQQQFLTMNMVKSNHKVAIFTDNEQDGVVMGKLWNEYAKKYNYEVVYHAKFPVGTTEYGDLIRRAQEGNADAIICQMITPDSIALWRQIKALGYKPKAAFFEKGGEPVEWWEALGKTANGTMVAGFWHPDLGIPGSKELRARFEKDTGAMYSQHIADATTAIQVLIDAIENNGSLEPKGVASAIAKTDKDYILGHIKYTEGKGGHAAGVPCVMLQWQDGETEIVYPPKFAKKKMIYPLP
jgi:branched-chain amino acid transport system substrate-binding protein